MIYLGIQNPTSIDRLFDVADVAIAYGAEFFTIGVRGVTPCEYQTLEEAQRAIPGTFIRVNNLATVDVIEYLAPKDAVYLLGEVSDDLPAIKVGTPTGKPLGAAEMAAVVLHDAELFNAGSEEFSKILGSLK